MKQQQTHSTMQKDQISTQLQPIPPLHQPTAGS